MTNDTEIWDRQPVFQKVARQKSFFHLTYTHCWCFNNRDRLQKKEGANASTTHSWQAGSATRGQIRYKRDVVLKRRGLVPIGLRPFYSAPWCASPPFSAPQSGAPAHDTWICMTLPRSFKVTPVGFRKLGPRSETVEWAKLPTEAVREQA